MGSLFRSPVLQSNHTSVVCNKIHNVSGVGTYKSAKVRDVMWRYATNIRYFRFVPYIFGRTEYSREYSVLNTNTQWTIPFGCLQLDWNGSWELNKLQKRNFLGILVLGTLFNLLIWRALMCRMLYQL